MKTIIPAIAFIFACSIATASISLTQEQFENQDIIHDKLRVSDTNYLGMSGSIDKMNVYGISDKEALKIIKKIDFSNERTIKEKPNKDKKNRIKAELEDLNLSEESVTFLLGGE